MYIFFGKKCRTSIFCCGSMSILFQQILSVWKRALTNKNLKTFLTHFFALCLPASRILPIQIQSVKVMLLDKLNDMFNKFSSSSRIVDKTAVFVTLAIIPTTNSNRHLDAVLLEISHLLVKFLKKYRKFYSKFVVNTGTIYVWHRLKFV